MSDIFSWVDEDLRFLRRGIIMRHDDVDDETRWQHAVSNALAKAGCFVRERFPDDGVNRERAPGDAITRDTSGLQDAFAAIAAVESAAAWRAGLWCPISAVFGRLLDVWAMSPFLPFASLGDACA